MQSFLLRDVLGRSKGTIWQCYNMPGLHNTLSTAKLSHHHLWPHEVLALAPHVLNVIYSSMVSSRQWRLGKNLHI